jgi:hypothetical protein
VLATYYRQVHAHDDRVVQGVEPGGAIVCHIVGAVQAIL